MLNKTIVKSKWCKTYLTTVNDKTIKQYKNYITNILKLKSKQTASLNDHRLHSHKSF